MNDLPGTFEELAARLNALEKRVFVLEHSSAVASEPAAMEVKVPTTIQPAADLSPAQAGGLFSVFGKAMLGIAGAYLLRAVAESTSLPKLAVAAIAIVYALLWLVWAARVKADTWVPSAIYAGASAVILAPMLWELTLSFKVLAPPVTAVVLAVFVIAASALAWKRDLAPVLWVANGTAALAALALGIATHQLVPFAAVLLFMALLCEAAAELRHELSLRPFLAAAADLAVWALIFIYAGPETARTDYPAVSAIALLAPSSILFLIYAASITLRTARLGQNISVFEALQATISFLLAASSVLYFAPHFGTIGLGVVCLLLSVACYALVFAAFRGFTAGRNPQVFSAWGTGLLLAGSVLCLPTLGLALCLGLAAISFTQLGSRFGRLTLQVHGLLLLVATAIASGLLAYIFHALAGPLPIHLARSVLVAAASAGLCYAFVKPASTGIWMQQSLRLIPAALAVCALSGLLVQVLLLLASQWVTPEIHHVAFIRTLVLSTITLGAAFAGARWHLVEFTRIAYSALALVAIKLVYEDLRHGQLEFIAASIFLFALALIAVPRLARMQHKI